MNKDIVYIADLDQDVDDIIAIEYLNKLGVLRCIVLDPFPKNKEGFERKEMLTKNGIEVLKKIPNDAKKIFVGGTLSLVATYIINHEIDYLVMNGGFVGNNIMEKPLEKFKNKQECRTYNFNCDVVATDKVLRSKNIKHIMLIGKNVCHDRRNTPEFIWKNEKDLFSKYNVRESKLQHDLLACYEGLIELGYLNDESYLDYDFLQPYNLGLNGTLTQWGSEKPNNENIYNTVKAAIKWK